MKQKELLKYGIDVLENENIAEGKVKAKQLLYFLLDETKEEYICNMLQEVPKKVEVEFIDKIDKIKNGKPLQYITNNKKFMSLDLFVNENVLIPQPDTEILVAEALKILLKENKKQCKVLDLCTGSGAIAVSVGCFCENCNILATDISDKAIEVADINVKKYKLEDRVKLGISNLFENISNEKFNMIISNPPYIETDEIENLSKEVKNEPILALDGGRDGLYFYRKILEQAHNYLEKDGYLLLEIGYNQGEKIMNEYTKSYKDKLEVVNSSPIKDFAGNDRVIILKNK